MKRVAATAILALGLLHGAGAVAAPDTTQTPQAAADQARAEAARQLHAQPSEFTVVSIEPAEWSDSSLGCRKPNVMYQEVMSSGYVVVLERDGQQHHVNVAGSRAVMCDGGTRLTGTIRRPLPASDEAKRPAYREHESVQGAPAAPPAQARAAPEDLLNRMAADLAARLRVNVAELQVVNVQSVVWDDSSLGCPQPERAYLPAQTPGLRVVFAHASKSYQYHASERGDFVYCEHPAQSGLDEK